MSSTDFLRCGDAHRHMRVWNTAGRVTGGKILPTRPPMINASRLISVTDTNFDSVQVFGRIHRRNRDIEDHVDAATCFLRDNG
jgi:hypothetical protein